jgi:hypothetical protein
MPKCLYTYPSSGQCPKDAVRGSDYCAKHQKDDEHDETALYAGLQAKYRSRIAGFKEHSEMRTLANEIALARLLITERFNAITTDGDLITATGPLNTLLMTVEKLVTSCHKIEHSLGSLLEKPALLRIAADIVQIVLDELPPECDKERVTDRIGQRIIEVVAETRN